MKLLPILVGGVISTFRYCVTPGCTEGYKLGRLDEVKEIAKHEGGVCLSQKYISERGYLTFKCKEGHNFLSSYENLKRGGWCGVCKK